MTFPTLLHLGIDKGWMVDHPLSVPEWNVSRSEACHFQAWFVNPTPPPAQCSSKLSLYSFGFMPRNSTILESALETEESQDESDRGP